MSFHQVVPKIYHTYSKIWVNCDWVIRFLGFLWWFLRSGARFQSPSAEIVCSRRPLLLLIFIRNFFGTPCSCLPILWQRHLTLVMFLAMFNFNIEGGPLVQNGHAKKGIWFCSALTHWFNQIESFLFLSMLLQLKKIFTGGWFTNTSLRKVSRRKVAPLLYFVQITSLFCHLLKASGYRPLNRYITCSKHFILLNCRHLWEWQGEGVQNLQIFFCLHLKELADK